jgi:hypothetical protein
MKKPQLWIVLEYFQEAQLLPSGDDAALTWADGLGSTQTTPGSSARAVPAPIVDLSIELSTLIAWLQLSNQGLERHYDC